MNLNGLTAAIAATGDALNAAEVDNAQLRAQVQQLTAKLAELQARPPEQPGTTTPGTAMSPPAHGGNDAQPPAEPDGSTSRLGEERSAAPDDAGHDERQAHDQPGQPAVVPQLVDGAVG